MGNCVQTQSIKDIFDCDSWADTAKKLPLKQFILYFL